MSSDPKVPVVVKPASPDAKDPTDGTANPDKKQGISPGEAKKLTVAGAPMSESQRQVANTILQQAVNDNAGPKPTKAMVVASIGESEMNPGAKDFKTGTHQGVFQSNVIPPAEVATQAHYFLIGGFSFAAGGAKGADKDHPTWTVGQIAGHVEVSGRNTTPSDPFYDKWGAEADAIIGAYGGVGSTQENTSSDTVAVSYPFTRGTPDHPDENSWDAAERLAGEVDGWLLFAVSNRFYYFSEQRLIRQQPILVIDRTDERVVSLSGTIDNTGNATEASLVLLCDTFEFHAGEVVKLTGAGAFSTGRWGGRWIVSETQRSRFELQTTLTLKLAADKGLEPAHDTNPVAKKTVPDNPGIGKGLLTKAQLNGHPQPNDNISKVAATVIAKYPRLLVTSSTDHSRLSTNGLVSLHVSGQAVDLAVNDAAYMLQAADWCKTNLKSILTEGIHNPNLSIKDMKSVAPSFWGAQTWAEHTNHIHLAVLDTTKLKG